ncbi:MAG: glycosyltransferase, partial [SAR324 cluster bacterium]
MKKILFLTSSLGLGGIEKSLIQVVNNLDKKLYEVEVCVKNGDEIEFLP